jgi:TetR/AcrR family transcriptional regulator, transcriptional repressor for nem operon
MARPKAFDRTEMLDKAMELFWYRGYEATSIHDLLEHLGINRQSLYDTFGDKHTLFLEALNRYKELGQTPMVEILEGPGSGKEAIARVFRQTVQSYAQDRPRCGCFVVNSTIELAPHNPEVAQCVVASFERTQQALSCALTRAKAQGELYTQHDLEGLARFLTTMLQGLHVAAKAGTDLVQLHEVARIALSILG